MCAPLQEPLELRDHHQIWYEILSCHALHFDRLIVYAPLPAYAWTLFPVLLPRILRWILQSCPWSLFIQLITNLLCSLNDKHGYCCHIYMAIYGAENIQMRFLLNSISMVEHNSRKLLASRKSWTGTFWCALTDSLGRSTLLLKNKIQKDLQSLLY